MFQLPCRRTDSLITITSGASGSGSGTVNYSVAANTLSISRSSSLTIAGLTHNVSQVGTGGGCTNTIVNPGFESGTTPWTFSGQVTRSTGSFPHSGTAYALQFWLNITTNEAAGASVFDRLFIEVRSTSGTLLATLATFSNQNSGTAGVYVLRGPFNLSSFAGQTVRIQFRGTNDVTLPTTFRVDDVSLQ